MPLAPEIASFGDGSHVQGESGLTINGGGFGAFPGEAWIYTNADRTGSSDQLTVGSWNDIELSSVSIPGTTANPAGSVFLFVKREDLAWSQAYAFTLESAAVSSSNVGSRPKRRQVYVVNVQGVDYVVETLAQAEALVRANTPDIEPPPKPEPLPSFSVVTPPPRPQKVALPRAQVGLRRLA